MFSRRLLLSSPLLALRARAAVRGQIAPSEVRRYTDPSTENFVQRLTDPKYRSFLPRFSSRPVGARSNALYHASDRLGSLQVFRLDLKSGQARQLTDAAALAPEGFAVFGDERNFCYFDGPALHLSPLSTLRDRQIYAGEDGWTPDGPPVVSDDGTAIVFAEKSGSGARIRAIRMPAASVATVASADEVTELLFKPKSRHLLWREANGFMLLDLDKGSNARPVPVKFAEGENRGAQFSADGQKLLYLNRPADRTKLNTIRELDLATAADKAVTKTSQFGAFCRNGDASVFVGASQSKAAPFVLIVLRIGRELTLCEHRASDVEQVHPLFSPNSQRIFFQSDRFGKPALFSMMVEKLVEETEEA